MLDFVVTDHWWDEYGSGRKNNEFRRKTPYWDKRIFNALFECYDEAEAKRIFQMLQEKRYVNLPLPHPEARIRHGYSSECRWKTIHGIAIKNGKETDLAIDEDVYSFNFDR